MLHLLYIRVSTACHRCRTTITVPTYTPTTSHKLPLPPALPSPPHLITNSSPPSLQHAHPQLTFRSPTLLCSRHHQAINSCSTTPTAGHPHRNNCNLRHPLFITVSIPMAIYHGVLYSPGTSPHPGHIAGFWPRINLWPRIKVPATYRPLTMYVSELATYQVHGLVSQL